MNCENCGCEHDGSYGDSLKSKPKNGQSKYRFCSVKCSRCFSTKEKRQEINKRVSIKMGGTGEISKYTQCQKCDCELKGSQKKFCSNKCQMAKLMDDTVDSFINGVIPQSKGFYINLNKGIRRYLISLSDGKCSKCGWCEVNVKSGKVPLQIDHIDGNPLNNSIDNLRVLCPNCHSLTPTFGRLNVRHGLAHRR